MSAKDAVVWSGFLVVFMNPSCFCMTALDPVSRPISDDLEHSGTSQEDGKCTSWKNYESTGLSFGSLCRNKEMVLKGCHFGLVFSTNLCVAALF